MRPSRKRKPHKRSKQRLFSDALCLPRRNRAFGAFQLLGQFFAYNGQLGRRLDANAHAAMTYFHNGDRDLVADQDPLADFSTEN